MSEKNRKAQIDSSEICEVMSAWRISIVGAELARDAGNALFQPDRVIVHREQARLPQESLTWASIESPTGITDDAGLALAGRTVFQ